MANRIPEIRAAMGADRKAYDGMTRVLDEIELERGRQIEAEGWHHAHDDEHSEGQLGRAALNYLAASCITTALQGKNYEGKPPLDGMGYAIGWPWERKWWKPGLVRRMLVKAAALIVAEIERLDRAEGR